ncbi:MAG: phosphatidylserine decarboxylase [Hahellaceae bacterium]|jgi:phosphatidylserine decarboxylase|nr:phosphatidylserine decarboxylase [Hahellaceae bacterium]MCP5211141.1 phosphatidylserine decarboxylase [Hahellaceae bacterium]
MSFDNLFVLSQYLVPQHGLSRAAGLLANSQSPAIKNAFIEWFVEKYQVNMAEAERPNPQDYATFNEFFTRALKEGARSIDQSADSVISPVDGAISQIGAIEHGRVFQAKGQSFSLTELLGGDIERAKPFLGGNFTTIYLSPKDYHRIHMPITGTLREMVFVPGKLFSVNPVTAEKVSSLFARNERVVAIFDTELGPMAMVLVGAMIVASIETTWAGIVAPRKGGIQTYKYEGDEAITIEKGEEMGRFRLGSTVILAFPQNSMDWETILSGGDDLRLGQKIASRSVK